MRIGDRVLTNMYYKGLRLKGLVLEIHKLTKSNSSFPSGTAVVIETVQGVHTVDINTLTNEENDKKK